MNTFHNLVLGTLYLTLKTTTAKVQYSFKIEKNHITNVLSYGFYNKRIQYVSNHKENIVCIYLILLDFSMALGWTCCHLLVTVEGTVTSSIMTKKKLRMLVNCQSKAHQKVYGDVHVTYGELL